MKCGNLNQAATQRYIKSMRQPVTPLASGTDLLSCARQHGQTSYHPTGTFRLGSYALAFVDPVLKARSLDGLRICDSSKFPGLVGPNTSAPTVMAADRATSQHRLNYVRKPARHRRKALTGLTDPLGNPHWPIGHFLQAETCVNRKSQGQWRPFPESVVKQPLRSASNPDRVVLTRWLQRSATGFSKTDACAG